MASSAAQPTVAVTVNVFPGGFNWPSFVAQDKRFFEQNALSVTLQPTRSSVAQMTGLAQGAFDIAMTAFDNVVAYVEGQGEAPIGPQPDFFAFMGSDNGFLNLVVSPAIKEFADLKGKTLSVDARTTGYAFVLFDVLRRHGLAVDSDYAIEAAGGMAQRWDALRAGRHAGTLLSTPFNILAREHNFHQLVKVTKAIGPYQGNVAAARRTWARENRATVIGFIRGYIQAVEWLYDRANREEAISILVKNVSLSPEVAARGYSELLHRKEGFFRKARISTGALRTVLALRNRYAAATKPLTDPVMYYDPSYYEAAVPAVK